MERLLFFPFPIGCHGPQFHIGGSRKKTVSDKGCLFYCQYNICCAQFSHHFWLARKTLLQPAVFFKLRRHKATHTGSFAQNSFQMDSINSCHTSKKLEFWLKIVNIIYFSTPKLIKGTLGFILEIMKKNARWRHKSGISKRNVKTMISPLLFRL